MADISLPAPVSAACETIVQLANKVALELVFAESGKDNGLLPANSLLGEIEERGAALAEDSPVREAIALARQWVDAIFERDALWDAVSLGRLGEWTHWIQNACVAATAGHPIAALPAGWREPAVVAAPGAVPAAAVPEKESAEPIQLDLAADAELLREFCSESHEHLQNIELGVLVLEESPTDHDTLNNIFRAFHTFKGGSGLLNLKPINRLAHDLESLLDLARQHKLSIDSQIINLILEGRDCLKQFLAEIESRLSAQLPNSPIVIPVEELVARVRAAVKGVGAGAGASSPASSAAAPKVSAPAAAPATTPAVSMSEASPAAASAEKSTPAATSPRPDAPAENRAAAAGAVVKVDTQKLDSLVDLVGELVIAQSLVVQDERLRSIQSEVLSRNLAQLHRITNELQRTAMTLRMVPIRATFQKMHRLVRDLAAKSGKQVQLTTSGEETELDRTIVEVINDPLVHMIRNSVDHGIEKPEVRAAHGKSPVGTVHLHACHEGGNILISISDDGAGLNKERIVAKAVEKGILHADEKLNEKEIYDLIFAPGFSTADKVTDISGRGVGMDVVRQNVARLRGKIEVQSTLGQGSKFTLGLPLTLAIIEGLVVRVGQERYIIPSLSVRESFRPTADMLCTVHERGRMVQVRGRLIPLLSLHELFDIGTPTPDPTRAIVVVVESGRDLRCLLVDDLVGKQEVVIKSLGELFKRHEALAGATILGDGRAGLILDIGALIKWAKNPLSLAA